MSNEALEVHLKVTFGYLAVLITGSFYEISSDSLAFRF